MLLIHLLNSIWDFFSYKENQQIRWKNSDIFYLVKMCSKTILKFAVVIYSHGFIQLIVV